jgi:hypothetical protein
MEPLAADERFPCPLFRPPQHFSRIEVASAKNELENTNMDSTLLDTAPALEYAGIFDRLERSLDEQLPRVAGERARAPRLLAELLALPERERRRAARGHHRFHCYALGAHALERAEVEAGTDLCAALDLARLGRLLASRTDSRHCGQAALEELRQRALAVEAKLLLAFGGVAV